MPAGDLPLWRLWRRRGYWLLTLAVTGVAGGLPPRPGRALGRLLARVAAWVRPRDLRRAAINLQRAFPELSPDARSDLIRASVRLLGENLADGLAAAERLRRPGWITEEFCPGTGGRPVGRVVADLGARGHGVLILTGHLGCWELLGGWLAAELPRHGAGPLAVVTGTIRNPPVDRLVQERRRGLGLLTLPRDGGAAPLLRHLRNGGVIAALLDQRLNVPSLDVPFFAHPAPTPAGLGRLVLRHGLAVLPVAIARRDDGHVVRHLPPLTREPDAGAARDDGQVARFLADCNSCLEELIRRNPAEWVWFHPRWEPHGLQ